MLNRSRYGPCHCCFYSLLNQLFILVHQHIGHRSYRQASFQRPSCAFTSIGEVNSLLKNPRGMCFTRERFCIAQQLMGSMPARAVHEAGIP